jgi:predicted Zn-dependent peptidase
MYHKKRLSNGMTLLVEEMPYLSSISVGIWIVTGSREEGESNNGISHLIEHMLFKGTKKRSASEIAYTLDRVGGRLNAFTSKEVTCYHATVMKEHFSLALDLLSDILFNSVLKEEEIEKEKQVIVEEINLYEDSPSEYINDLLVQTIFPRHSLGQPISGKREVVVNIKRDEILKHLAGYYTPGRFVISIAGNIGFDEAEKSIENFFVPMPADVHRRDTGSRIPTTVGTGSDPAPSFSPGLKIFSKDLNQVHLCIGTPGIPHNNEARYAFSVLNLILGGGMSSRLFQKVREKYGLVYAIYSYPVSFRDTGYAGIYAGTTPESFFQVLELILSEIMKLKKEGITNDELSMGKEHMKGGFLISLESSEARMSRLANSEIYLGRVIPIEEVLSKIEEVTLKNVMEIAGQYLKKELMSVVTLGPGMEEEKIRETIRKVME